MQDSILVLRLFMRFLVVAGGLAVLEAAWAGAIYRCPDDNGGVLISSTRVGPECQAVPIEKDDLPQPSASFAGKHHLIKIFRQADGHFYVDGSIGGKHVRFIIDTGATSVMVGAALAAAANVSASEVMAFQTAGGTVIGAMADDVPVAIANLAPLKTKVAINPGLEGEVALLGQDYLNKFKITIQGSTMELALQ